MALLIKRQFSECFLELRESTQDQAPVNHIFEPEFHQDLYVKACSTAQNSKGAFQLGDLGMLVRSPNRGVQPIYVDDENDADSLIFVGMLDKFGKTITKKETTNVCALKSISVRAGFVDFGVARSVSEKFFETKKKRASVQKNDLLINSTGDGTIGRVAIYNANFPALVDGHITIVRFKNADLSWYVAAYLMSEQGQRQIYRYINGSSGQVEIYPQDIERLWIPGATDQIIKNIADKFRSAIKKYEEFQKELVGALSAFP